MSVLNSMYRLLFGFWILCFFSCENQQINTNKNSDKFNILFIVADDLNCDLGTYGNDLVHSPNIDSLASKGFQFDNAHCQYPHCGPSRASMMTGMYSDQTKINQNNIYLRSTVPDVITLSQRFKQQGYHAIRIGKIFHLDNPGTIGTSGIDDIYSWSHTINPYGRDKIDEHLIKSLAPRRYGGTLSWLKADGYDREQTDGIAADEAIEQIEKLSKSGDNFFLALGFVRPHLPFVAPSKYFDYYDIDDINIPKLEDDYLSSLPLPAIQSIRSRDLQLNLQDSISKEIKQAYLATVSFVDSQVGRVLNKLEETGLDKNTIVVFTSDHGFHLGDHGHWQKQTLFETSTRVPLIFYVPNSLGSNISTNIPVELIDIYPTLLDLVDISAPKYLSGNSLKEIINQSSYKHKGSALTKWSSGYSIKTKRYRFTCWGDNGELGYELYDHLYDQGELNNLANDPIYNDVFDSLKLVINTRILQAREKPLGIGRQFEGVTPIHTPRVVTYGDIHDLDGNITYYKNE